MELRGRGWTIVAAAREVGISRTAANNWAGGYKVYRKGQVVGVVTPLDRLTVREISPRYLSQEERIEIADLHHAGVSVRKIATQLGRAPSTVSRELRRSPNKCGYRPFEAHRQAASRRARDHKRRVEKNSELRRIVGELLAQRWSPQQIARHKLSSIPTTGRCGCATRASTRRSISPAPGSCGLPESLRRTVRLCEQGVITAGLSSRFSGAGHGSNSR